MHQIVRQILGRWQYSRERLILVYGGDWQMRTRVLRMLAQSLGAEYISLGQQVPQCLLNIPAPSRPFQLPSILQEIVALHLYLCLDHLEILFQPELRFRPLEWLHQLARLRGVIAAWPGHIDPEQKKAWYATPTHPDYREGALQDLWLLEVPLLKGQLSLHLDSG